MQGMTLSAVSYVLRRSLGVRSYVRRFGMGAKKKEFSFPWVGGGDADKIDAEKVGRGRCYALSGRFSRLGAAYRFALAIWSRLHCEAFRGPGLRAWWESVSDPLTRHEDACCDGPMFSQYFLVTLDYTFD